MGKRKREYDFIAHVCLNSELKKSDKNHCEGGFIAEAPNKSTKTEQCWKYCDECVKKGFKQITVEERVKSIREKNKDRDYSHLHNKKCKGDNI